MKEEFDTSRWVVVDLVEVIKEQLAIYSHLQELYKEVVDTIDALTSSWANQDSIDEEAIKAVRLKKEIKNVYSRRQKAMQELKTLAKDYDHKARCLVKHSIKEWWIAEEVWNTDMDNERFEEIMLDAETFCYKCLSLFLWTEIVTCWRCLTDELLPSNDVANAEKEE